MDLDLEELLEQWLCYNAPFILHDPELVTNLLRFIHAILCRAVQEERRSAQERTLKPSRN